MLLKAQVCPAVVRVYPQTEQPLSDPLSDPSSDPLSNPLSNPMVLELIDGVTLRDWLCAQRGGGEEDDGLFDEDEGGWWGDGQSQLSQHAPTTPPLHTT